MVLDIILLVIAFGLDLAFGEPPLIVHPVFWFGKIVEFFDKFRSGKPGYDFVLGTLTVLSVVTFAYLLCSIPLNVFVKTLWGAYLLFSSISVRSMVSHVEECIKSNMDPEKVQMIVSRDTSKLSTYQLNSAVIESVAENFVDGVFAPIFYFVIFGLPGAVIYRAVNVCDAMVGYRNEKYEYFGKFAARLDDILNYIPSRISLLLYEIVKRGSFVYGIKNRVKLNGCTIPAMSYVLEVKLEKPGSYSLPGRFPDIEDVTKSIKLFKKLSMATFLLAISFLYFKVILINSILK